MRHITQLVVAIVGCAILAGSGSGILVAQEEFSKRQRTHWAWKPPIRTPEPAVRDADWVENPIDAFVLARLEEAGLKPATPARPEHWLRRVTVSLTGLPPTPEELTAFLQDRSPGARERVIDRLLASPRYGERWARHWLDLARYADTNGYEHDEVRPDAWRYRDYVVRAFNQDKPYDQFVLEQVAGDELRPEDPDAVLATGFHLLGPDMTDAAEQAQRRQNTLNDMTDTTALAFVGLTLACCRCHDHKFEPLPQADYYRFQAFFAPAGFRRDLIAAPGEQRVIHERALAAWQRLVQPLQQERDRLEAPYQAQLQSAKLARLGEDARAAHATPPERRTAAQKELVERTNRLIKVSPAEILKALSAADRARHDDIQRRLKSFDSKRPAGLPVGMGLKDEHLTAQTAVLERGELHQPSEVVQPGFPRILASDLQATVAAIKPVGASTGRRAALARWLVRPDHPLTARVLVNRLWQHHFGRGLVSTPNDFGVRGQPPTHPELLDWLALEFVERGWSLKQMQRLLLLSATYAQSCAAAPATLAADPDNLLFSRMNRLRLEGEVVRDTLLFTSGILNERPGGPGVFPPLPAEVQNPPSYWKVSKDQRDFQRRSIYLFAGRNVRFPFLEVFDLPDTTLSCPQRERSTTAPQALALLNAEEVRTASTELAARLVREAPSDLERVRLLYRLVLSRSPASHEEQRAQGFLQHSPLSELCRALFNGNEFFYLD